MDIRINSDNHISNSKRFSQELSESLSHSLERFSPYITTLEVYLSDENGIKGGERDKKCSIEAHIKKLPPLAVGHKADTLRKAFHGATRKLKSVINDSLERRSNYSR
jgi:hypothetical protein